MCAFYGSFGLPCAKLRFGSEFRLETEQSLVVLTEESAQKSEAGPYPGTRKSERSAKHSKDSKFWVDSESERRNVITLRNRELYAKTTNSNPTELTWCRDSPQNSDPQNPNLYPGNYPTKKTPKRIRIRKSKKVEFGYMARLSVCKEIYGDILDTFPHLLDAGITNKRVCFYAADKSKMEDHHFLWIALVRKVQQNHVFRWNRFWPLTWSEIIITNYKWPCQTQNLA